MVRPVLEYGSSIWDPHIDKLQKELEKVQNRAARFVTRNYVYETGSMTGILGQLKWESLKKRRKDNSLIFIAPAFSKVRYRGSTFRPFVRPSVRPSTICVESRKFTSRLGINFISLQQW